jgi:lysophospholipase L1-like esterase
MMTLGAMMRASRRRREWLVRALLVTGGLLLSLVALEGSFRATAGVLPAEIRNVMQATPDRYGVHHPYIGHLHKPNATIVLAGRDFEVLHHTDGRGFRNPWPWPEYADIVVVGDSLVFGYGVADHEAWPALLARAIPGTRIVNLGLIGAGPQQYLRVFETFGLPLRPRLVVVGLFPQNDFWDAGLFERWLRSDEPGWNYMVWRDFGQPRADKQSRPGTAARLKAMTLAGYFAARHSYVFNLGERAAKSAIRRQWRDRLPIELADGGRLELFPADFNTKTAGARAGRPELGVVVDAVKTLAVTAAGHGARMVVVLEPSKEETYLPLVGRRFVDPSAALRQALDELGIPSVDLGPAFRSQAQAGARLFFEVDGHPNAAGHAVIANGVRRGLAEAGLLRPDSSLKD